MRRPIQKDPVKVFNLDSQEMLDMWFSNTHLFRTRAVAKCERISVTQRCSVELRSREYGVLYKTFV